MKQDPLITYSSPEAVHGPPPSWGSRALGAVLASCQRLVPNLQPRYDPHALDDHLLCDIGL